MKSRAPRAVGELLVSALPQLEERLLVQRMRRAWGALVGDDLARRAQPQALVKGCLTIVVDNSPWLHELTLRTPELTARLHAQFPTVQSLRFSLGAAAAAGPAPSPGARRRRRRPGRAPPAGCPAASPTSPTPPPTPTTSSRWRRCSCRTDASRTRSLPWRKRSGAIRTPPSCGRSSRSGSCAP